MDREEREVGEVSLGASYRDCAIGGTGSQPASQPACIGRTGQMGGRGRGRLVLRRTATTTATATATATTTMRVQDAANRLWPTADPTGVVGVADDGRWQARVSGSIRACTWHGLVVVALFSWLLPPSTCYMAASTVYMTWLAKPISRAARRKRAGAELPRPRSQPAARTPPTAV